MGVAALAGVLAVPTTTRAASCAAQTVLVWPSDGAIVPRNGTLLFEQVGCGDALLTFVEPIGYEAFIDDVLVDLEEGPDPRFGGNGRWIDPAPAIGSTVLVTNCAPDCDGAISGTDDVRVEFTIGDSDDEPPAPATLGALDYTLGSVEDTYEGTRHRYRDWALTVGGARPDDPRVYRIAFGVQGEPPDFQWRFSDAAQLELELRTGDEQAGETVCVEVTAFDQAGNAGEPVVSCRTLDESETLDADEGDGATGCRAGGPKRSGSALALGLLLLLLGVAGRRSRLTPRSR